TDGDPHRVFVALNDGREAGLMLPRGLLLRGVLRIALLQGDNLHVIPIRSVFQYRLALAQ
ncbi:hypothetical protein ACOY6I_22870, partial [Enterobacter hormaechei]